MIKRKRLYFKGLQLKWRVNKRLTLKLTNIFICLIILVAAISFSIRGIIKLTSKEQSKLTVIDKSDVAVIAKEVEPEVETAPTVNIVEEEPEIVEPEVIEPEYEVLTYRMTSYYNGDDTDSGTTTASGKSIKDFQINDKGWYTYQGKLVIATANKRLLSWSQYVNSTQRLFNLYDELILVIDGVEYEAIVLDVCGAAMKRPIIDLFVSNRQSIKDTTIQIKIK